MPPRLIAARLPANESSVRLIEKVWDSGDALLPLDIGLTDLEISELLARMKPHVFLEGPEEVALDDPAPIGKDTALVIATSGTTGSPKGVTLTHRALEAAIRMTNRQVGAEQGRRWLCCLPLSHVAGMMTLLRSRALGSEVVIHSRFDIEAIRSEQKADYMSVVPTMLRRLLDADVDLRRFARVLVGGAAATDELVARVRDTGARVSVTYGMTETCGGVVYDGRPLSDVDVQLDRHGRISIASPTLMDGYRQDPDATERALVGNRLVTQDQGEWGDDGRLRVTGRLDRTIITGGKNVSPGEIEEALRSHPEVLDAVIRGEPDELWGQVILAEVVPRHIGRPPTEGELKIFLEDRVARHKIPRAIRVDAETKGGSHV